MITKVVVCLCLFGLSVSENTCYWNKECGYQLFGSKTPYDAVRGDIRDLKKPEGCQAISFWSLHRHGNRNPGSSVTRAMKAIAQLKDDIIAAYEEGRSQLCATDIDLFRKFTWNDTMDTSASYLTGVGYEELYDMGSRVRVTYPELFTGTDQDYYFRPTNEQRTVTSAMAFVHGLTDGTNLTMEIDDVRVVEDVARPYENCDRYQLLVKEAPAVANEVAAFENSDDYVAIRTAVQQRLGISYQITSADLYSFYEICRFYRSWNERLQSPWCSVFTDEDLVVLDYRDDVRHYHRNGYGSWVNSRLGELPMKDLYESMEEAVQGGGRKITSYFTHDTMMEMVYCALGLYRDPEPLTGAFRNENRLWRSSVMGAMAFNLMAVLNSCQESGIQTYRVQIFIGEKVTDICPLEGCTWAEFQEHFQRFSSANLDFCSLDYPGPGEASTPGIDLPVTDGSTISATMYFNLTWMLFIQIYIVIFR